ncbi:MAG: nucleotidyltransferase family protein [Terriglobia bacterium]
MNSIVQARAAELQEVCRLRNVLRLSLFGSATRSSFDAASSDLDFVVEFRPLSPAAHADSYFGLQEDLEELFGRPVDLVEPGPIRNPYFRQAVERTQVLVYAAP